MGFKVVVFRTCMEIKSNFSESVQSKLAFLFNFFFFFFPDNFMLYFKYEENKQFLLLKSKGIFDTQYFNIFNSERIQMTTKKDFPNYIYYFFSFYFHIQNVKIIYPKIIQLSTRQCLASWQTSYCYRDDRETFCKLILARLTWHMISSGGQYDNEQKTSLMSNLSHIGPTVFFYN